jgi:four helix bundle protein
VARPKSYVDLIVWQKAMILARKIYKVSEGLPRNEAYGLLTQLRRAAVSLPSNIAEGHGRLTDLQFRHFLGNARGSLYEIQTQLRLAGDLGYLNEEVVCEVIEEGWEVARLTNALISSIARHSRANSTNAANSAEL